MSDTSHFDEEDNTKYKVPDNIKQILNTLDETPDFEITNFTDPDKIKEIEKQYLETLKKQKKIEREKLKKGDTSAVKAEKIAGGQRIQRPEKKDKEILEDIKQAQIKPSEYNKVLNQAKDTIKSISNAANEIEKTIDLTYVKPKKVDKPEEFLLQTEITDAITNVGIDTDKFINMYKLFNYKSKNSPDAGVTISIPEQLVLINKLSKMIKFQLLQQTDAQIKFVDVDKTLSSYIKFKNASGTYKLSYVLLKEMLKKMLVASLTTVESAFRSSNIWVTPEFKKLITKDAILLQCLPEKLRKSFNIFVEELTKIKDARIYDNLKSIDILIHTAPDFALEETLARSIKCMTPCFIYDYFNAIKSVYIFCGLYNTVLDNLSKQKNNFELTDELANKQNISNMISLMAKVCSLMYQNTRLYQNSTARSLPYSKDEISEYAQMYYLNHTLTGPQYYLLKIFENLVPALKI